MRECVHDFAGRVGSSAETSLVGPGVGLFPGVWGEHLWSANLVSPGVPPQLPLRRGGEDD